ncbi:carboxylesterase/lipase family protein [Microbacterium sediminicola]|uniref:Carboxylic ester hydrolase n=1 Tax=Microbacterium sediminicola TaxID=415210 RepID=A0ABP4UCB1_9MICO
MANTPAGAFRGEPDDHDTRVWRGIRYALPPTGNLRWRAPRAAPDVDGVVDATAFGAVAPQPTNPAIQLGPDAVMSEDCLFLNVWAPEVAHGSMPVMVWIHGGAYTFGASSQPVYNGASLARRGVVVVTINYRIGSLGFLDLTGLSTSTDPFDGNLALRDVLLALAWVQRNIGDFGGDPGQVTVFGESAGAGMVTTLLATPSAEGLFSRAIAESSPVSSVYDADRAAGVTRAFLEIVGDPTPVALRSMELQTVVEAGITVFNDVPTRAPGTIAFGPVIDGDLIPEAPLAVLADGRGLRIPLLIGTNKDEASLFRLMKSPLMPIHEDDIDQMLEDLGRERPDLDLPAKQQILSAYERVRHRMIGMGIARDIGFRMPTLWAAEGHSRHTPVWLYRFDHAPLMLRLLGIGATHASELPYVWGTLGVREHDITFRLGGRKSADRLSERMQQRWVAFAKGGAPDAAGATSWPAFDTDTRAALVIDDTDTAVNDLDAALRTGWGDSPLAFP